MGDGCPRMDSREIYRSIYLVQPEVDAPAVDAVDVAEVVVNGGVIRKNAALVQSALQRVIVW